MVSRAAGMQNIQNADVVWTKILLYFMKELKFIVLQKRIKIYPFTLFFEDSFIW